MSLVLPKRVRRAALGGLMAFAMLFLTGCDTKTSLRRFAMPEATTKEAPLIFDLWFWFWVTALLVGVLVWGLILYAVIRFRRRDESEIPVQMRYHLPIEVFYTIAPIMMVIVLFYFTVGTQRDVLKDNPNPDHEITVVGQQWSWTFNYNLTYDDKSKSYEQAGGQVVHEVGTTEDKPVLYLVKGQSVRLHLASPDVIHSFWVPTFLFKMDVVPGRHNHFTVTPTREGTFEGRCAELCGVYHSRMLFQVKVVDEATYNAHLKKLADEGNTGKAVGASEVTKITGLDSDQTQGGR